MKPLPVVLAWALSALPFFLEVLSGGTLAWTGASRFGLALLPWLALVGLPRSARKADGTDGHGAAVPVVLSLALPPLALGLGLDWRAGADPDLLGFVLALGVLQLLAWGGAAELARHPGRARSLYGAIWGLVVPGVALVVVAVGWAPGGGGMPAWMRGAAGAPLVWAHARAAPGGLDPGPSFTEALVLIPPVLLWMATRALAQREEGGAS